MSGEWLLEYSPLIDRAVGRWAKGISTDEREDLKQDCWVRVLEKQEVILAKISGMASTADVMRYLSIVFRNAVLDGLENQEADPAEQISDEMLKIPDPSSEEPKFNTVIANLTVLERSVIAMRFRDRTSQNEIAEHFGRTRAWVRNVQKRAIEKLKAEEN